MPLWNDLRTKCIYSWDQFVYAEGGADLLHSQNWYSVEDGDPILKLLWGVSSCEIQLEVGIHSELDFLVN